MNIAQNARASPGIGYLDPKPLLVIAVAVIIFGLLLWLGGLVVAVPALIGTSSLADAQG